MTNWVYSSFSRLAQYLKIINAIHHIKKLMKKNHMIVSMQKKASEKIRHSFTHIHTHTPFRKLRIERRFLNLITDVYENLTSNITVSLGKTQGCQVLKEVLQFIVSVIRQEKDIKDI